MRRSWPLFLIFGIALSSFWKFFQSAPSGNLTDQEMFIEKKIGDPFTATANLIYSCIESFHLSMHSGALDINLADCLDLKEQMRSHLPSLAQSLSQNQIKYFNLGSLNSQRIPSSNCQKNPQLSEVNTLPSIHFQMDYHWCVNQVKLQKPEYLFPQSDYNLYSLPFSSLLKCLKEEGHEVGGLYSDNKDLLIYYKDLNSDKHFTVQPVNNIFIDGYSKIDQIQIDVSATIQCQEEKIEG